MRIDVSKVSITDYKNIRFTIMMTEEQRLKLGAMAKVRNVTISRFIRHIIDQVIREQGEQALEEIDHLKSTAVVSRAPGRPPKEKRSFDFD